MDRLAMSDAMWERVAPHLPGKPGDSGRSAAGNRPSVGAVSWMARTGAPWRDPPNSFGPWNPVFRRFRRWAKSGVFGRLFAVLSGGPDFERAMVGGTTIRVRQHGTGAKGGLPTGRSCVRAAV